VNRLEPPLPGLAAKWDAECARCGDPIAKGDRIVYHGGKYIHCRCASGADE
jgi:hypothetical protein